MENALHEKHLGTLPISAAAYSFLRKRFETLPDNEMAGVEFGPWELADLCVVPTAKQWKVASPEVPRILKIASQMVRNNKAGLIRTSANIDSEELHDLMRVLSRWTFTFRMHLAMLEAAQDRMIVTIAALSEQGPGQSEV